MLRPKTYKLPGDKLLLILPLALSIFGLIVIFGASSVSALRDFNDKFHYLENQSIWLVLGMILFFIFSSIDYKILKKVAFPFFFLSLFCLLLVLIPSLGRQVYGGRRWLQIGFLGFQPAELTKFSMIIYLSTLFEKKREFLPFLVIVGIVLGLLILEPDLGTATIVISTAFAIYFVAGAPPGKILTFLSLSLVAVPVLIFLAPYRKQRLLSFLNSSFEANEASYHVKQILIALGSGGILGRGLGQSRQKFLFLPEVTTDSIFAIIGEELGFLGALLLIFTLAFLVYRSFRLALIVKDPFAKLLVTGIAFCIGFQIAVNLGAMVVLVPLTGIPLPFVSYGGSSLLVCLAGMGIIYNISKVAAKERR